MGVRVHVSDETVTVDLSGVDRLWGLCGHLELPTASITSARVVPIDEAKADGLGWRLGGTYWPGLVAAGWYSVPDRPGARQFWCTYRDPEVLVIDLDRDRPSRVVLQHPDREFLAWIIGERVPV